jgi:hypothetical protein
MIDVPAEFLAFLKDEEAKAEDSDTDSRRTVAIDFYNGEPFGDEEDGRSQLVTRDVAEVVDYMTVSLLRTVVSGDRVVEFEGRSMAQDQYSDDATETVTQNFMRRQKGYQLVHDWIKAGLIEITGVVKTYAEPQDPKRHVMQNVPAEALPLIEQQGMKVIEAEESKQMDEQGSPTLNIAVHQPQPPKFCDYAVPNEEFRCAPDARDLDSAIYLAHVPPKTISDLRQMGFDADDLDELQSSNSAGMNALEVARNGATTNINMADRDGANRRVAYREEHVLYDLNGDGIAERLMVSRVDSHVLAVEAVDDHPFEEWCPFPMPHRRIGQSLAEKVMDIQRTRSVVLRQTMDGFYFSNAPRTFVNEDSLGESTIEDLLTVRPGSIVRFRGVPPIETQSRFDTSAGLSMLEQMIGERESRTGITRLNQGLDADALNKTATGTALMQAQGQQIEEYLARNFAESLARLFSKKLKIMKKHGGIQPMKVDGQFKQVDPSQWDEEMDLSVNVGLGSGKKEQRLANRMALLEIQRECIANGLRIVGEQEIYNSMKGVIADSGLGEDSDFVKNPAQLGPAPQDDKPDPEMAKVQADAAIEQAKVNAKMQSDNAAHNAEMMKAQAKAHLEEGVAMARMEVEQTKANAAAQLARDKADFEARLAQQKADFEARMAERQMHFDAQHQEAKSAREHEAKMSQNREGGDLSK